MDGPTTCPKCGQAHEAVTVFYKGDPLVEAWRTTVFPCGAVHRMEARGTDVLIQWETGCAEAMG